MELLFIKCIECIKMNVNAEEKREKHMSRLILCLSQDLRGESEKKKDYLIQGLN
jgi:hypothetical protein